MNERRDVSDDALRELLERRARLAGTEGQLAAIRSAAAATPQRRPVRLHLGFVHGFAVGAAGVASLGVLIVVLAVVLGSRVPVSPIGTTASALPSSEPSSRPPATPVIPGASEPVLPLTVDQLNAILLPNSSALLGRQLVITGTIELNVPVILGGPCCSPRTNGQQAVLVGSTPSLGFEVTGGGASLPAALPFTGTFAATMLDTRTLEYGGVVKLASSGGAFLPSQLPEPANSTRGGLWLARGWIAGFDHPFPCPSLLGPFIGPRYNGCGAQSSLSDTGSQPVSGETFRVPSGGILIQDRAYDDFAPDPQLTAAGTQPELATFLVYPVLVARCGNCLITADDFHWAIAARIDPWPAPGLTALPTTAPPPSATAIQPVQPLTVSQLNTFMAMNSQSPADRQLVIIGTIEPDATTGICSGACTGYFLQGTNPRLAVDPGPARGAPRWTAGGLIGGAFAAVLTDNFVLDYRAPVSLSPGGNDWLPSELPSPSATGSGGGYWLVQGWLAGFDRPFPCGPIASQPSGPKYNGCGAQSSLSDTWAQPVSGTSFRVPSDGVLVEDNAYDDFAPDPQLNPAGTQPEQATFLLQAVAVPACGPPMRCPVSSANYRWAIVTRIGPWPVPALP